MKHLKIGNHTYAGCQDPNCDVRWCIHCSVPHTPVCTGQGISLKLWDEGWSGLQLRTESGFSWGFDWMLPVQQLQFLTLLLESLGLLKTQTHSFKLGERRIIIPFKAKNKTASSPPCLSPLTFKSTCFLFVFLKPEATWRKLEGSLWLFLHALKKNKNELHETLLVWFFFLFQFQEVSWCPLLDFVLLVIRTTNIFSC